MNQEFITFRLSRPIACYITAYVQDAAIKAAIAKAFVTAQPDAPELQVTIHEAQVAVIYSALANVPAGIAAAPNEVFSSLAAPYLESNPRMAGMIAEADARNQAAFEQVLQNGEKEMQRIIHLLNIN